MKTWQILVATILATSPATAIADPFPITFVVGAGARVQSSQYQERHEDHQTDLAPALEMTVAYRLPHHLAIGVHAGASRLDYSVAGIPSSGNQTDEHYNLIPVDVGITLQYERDRVWLAPWLGRHVTRAHVTTVERQSGVFQSEHERSLQWNDNFTSFGLTGGVDVLGSGSDRLTIFADVQLAAGTGVPYEEPLFDYSAVTLGLAYRR